MQESPITKRDLSRLTNAQLEELYRRTPGGLQQALYDEAQNRPLWKRPKIKSPDTYDNLLDRLWWIGPVILTAIAGPIVLHVGWLVVCFVGLAISGFFPSHTAAPKASPVAIIEMATPALDAPIEQVNAYHLWHLQKQAQEEHPGMSGFDIIKKYGK